MCVSQKESGLAGGRKGEKTDCSDSWSAIITQVCSFCENHWVGYFRFVCFSVLTCYLKNKWRYSNKKFKGNYFLELWCLSDHVCRHLTISSIQDTLVGFMCQLSSLDERPGKCASELSGWGKDSQSVTESRMLHGAKRTDFCFEFSSSTYQAGHFTSLGLSFSSD